MADTKSGAVGEKITKMEAVRRALAKMGRKAKPSEIQPYVKATFGIEMSTDHISTYKGNILNKKRAKKPAAPAAPAAPDSKPRAPRAAGGSILLEDVLTAKALLDRIGAERLHVLIDGLAKKA
jgi:hypothetical protein